MVALLTPGGAIQATRYAFSTDVGLRHPVMERHATFGAGSSLITCVDLSNTGHDRMFCTSVCVCARCNSVLYSRSLTDIQGCGYAQGACYTM